MAPLPAYRLSRGAPVILRPENYAQWTDGAPDDALALVRTCDDALVVDRTTELWFKKREAWVGVGRNRKD